ncbi:Bm-brown protein [Operophtera brumata]|uniref:Bm-brown protein n=1 Tax=Operophtera brumata TaxID=104452 RepID=A0A0L7LH76_OPEBR|nr:Bm-brown protein [Operophtera brumata]
MIILNNGRIKQGEFAAVLGPSGAGKTTFLVSLAGKCTLPSEGTVMVNDTNVRDLHAVEMVPQFEVFFDGLSVIEHLVFMLLSNPQILISDEPTSGLDSYNASLVISALKKLSKSGKIVICSIHQPSCDIFREFNSLMLIAEGKMVFHGSLDECKAVFESINLHCPLNYNPAEFYIRAVSNQSEGYVEKIMESYHDRSLEYDGTSLDTSLGHIQL